MSSGPAGAASSTPSAVRPVPIIATAAGSATSDGHLVHRRGLAHRQRGVAAARLAEVGDRAAAEPGRVHALPDRVDDPGDLAARRHRQVGQRERPAGPSRRGSTCRAGGPRPRRPRSAPARAGLRVGHLLEAQDLGRAELVLADGVHGGDATRARGVSPRAIGPRTAFRSPGRREGRGHGHHVHPPARRRHRRLVAASGSSWPSSSPPTTSTSWSPPRTSASPRWPRAIAARGVQAEAVQRRPRHERRRRRALLADRGHRAAPSPPLALNAGVGAGGAFADRHRARRGAPADRPQRQLDGPPRQARRRATWSPATRAGSSSPRRSPRRCPGAFQAVYNASKSFVQSFALALRNELKDTEVTVTSLMPGPTETEFFERADMLDTHGRRGRQGRSRRRRPRRLRGADGRRRARRLGLGQDQAPGPREPLHARQREGGDAPPDGRAEGSSGRDRALRPGGERRGQLRRRGRSRSARSSSSSLIASRTPAPIAQMSRGAA